MAAQHRAAYIPITAKFSKEFYDKLGHDVVEELVNWLNEVDATYRSELRELNELNFARFDAKLEQRMSALETKLLKWLFLSTLTILGTMIALLKL